MKITAIEEYGLRCLLRVAEGEGEPISAQIIADREGLSVSYTQKLMRVLTMGELVESRRGAHGGFVLARPVDEVTLGDAIRVLGGVFDIDEICDRHTGEMKSCANQCHCTIRPVWSYISRFVIETLDAITLANLLNDERAVARHLEESVPPMSTRQGNELT
jgi:Rrf2 family transcriptional regulator, iron-sulfur cluster assembly transcription factor